MTSNKAVLKRISYEAASLTKKLHRLSKFVDSPHYQDISEKEQDLLNLQGGAMHLYQDILETRERDLQKLIDDHSTKNDQATLPQQITATEQKIEDLKIEAKDTDTNDQWNLIQKEIKTYQNLEDILNQRLTNLKNSEETADDDCEDDEFDEFGDDDD